jgi:hypothetical protein
MVLGAAQERKVQKRRGVVLALFDVSHNGIDHVVLYGGAEGRMTDCLGSRDPGPFDTRQETCTWLLRAISAWSPPLHG